MTDIFENINMYSLNIIISTYLDAARTYTLPYTNRIVNCVTNQDSISFLEKKKKIIDEILDLEIFVRDNVDEKLWKLCDLQLNCAKNHMLKILPDAKEIDLALEYWRVVDDLIVIERLLKYKFGSEKLPREHYDNVLVYWLNSLGFNARVEYYKKEEDYFDHNS